MRKPINNKRGIQSGDNTHHHDHAITLVSLRPTKRTVSNPVKPMPPEEEEEEALMIEDDGEVLLCKKDNRLVNHCFAHIALASIRCKPITIKLVDALQCYSTALIFFLIVRLLYAFDDTVWCLCNDLHGFRTMGRKVF